MADKKISALTAASTPLAGTEVLPIVQSSTTVKVAVSDLTAGRTFSALGMTLTSTDAGATAAPTIDLYRDSASPAASDTLGEIEFNGEDSAGNKQAYGVIHASILSPTSTAEQGQLHFETATAGALTEKMIIGTSNLVINEIGAVFNVRIEGDTDANLFYTDATNSRVGVGTISPAEKLDVVGKIKTSDNLVIGTSSKGVTTSSAIPLGFGTNGSTTQAILDTSGNVQVTGRTYTISGSNTIGNGVTQTLFTLNTGDVYIVNCSFANFSGGTTTALVWLPQSGNTSYSGAATLGQNFASFSITVSGASVQISNSGGGTVSYVWSAIKLY
jgi:hypothetical protein